VKIPIRATITKTIAIAMKYKMDFVVILFYLRYLLSDRLSRYASNDSKGRGKRCVCYTDLGYVPIRVLRCSLASQK
jgi:hypothetical protein